MRLFADENVPSSIVEALRRLNHDVASVQEELPSSADVTILARAQAESRVILTFDKDFGELAFRAALPATSGIVLVRLTGSTPEQDNERVIAALTSLESLTGRFVVIEDDRIRVRPLPAAGR